MPEPHQENPIRSSIRDELRAEVAKKLPPIHYATGEYYDGGYRPKMGENWVVEIAARCSFMGKDTLNQYHIDNYSGRNEDFTRVTVVDLAWAPPGQYDPSKAIVCMKYKSRDNIYRKGGFNAAYVVDRENVPQFLTAIHGEPELLYKLFRSQFGQEDGTVMTAWGEPMDIFPGKEIEFVPNPKCGGQIRGTMKSRPFNEDFDPNPIKK